VEESVESSGKRQLLVSRGWVQAVVLIVTPFLKAGKPAAVPEANGRHAPAP
jgi:hypothetical protein